MNGAQKERGFGLSTKRGNEPRHSETSKRFLQFISLHSPDARDSEGVREAGREVQATDATTQKLDAKVKPGPENQASLLTAGEGCAGFGRFLFSANLPNGKAPFEPDTHDLWDSYILKRGSV